MFMARKRNRRKNVRSNVVPVPLAVVLLGAVVFALGYLWLGGRCEALGREIKASEKRKLELQRQTAVEESKWSNLTTPQNMERLLQTHRLAMTWPSEKSIVRIYEDGVPRGRTAAGAQYAQRKGTTAHD